MFAISRLHQACRYRSYCTIPLSNSSPPLFLREKSRPLLSNLKSAKDPERVLHLIRSASLTPEAYIDRICFSIAINKLVQFNHFDGIRQFLEELKNRPDLQNEGFLCHVMIWYGQANMIDDAILSFKKMDELGIPRSVKSLNALLVACVTAKNYEEQCRIFREFPKIYGIEPNLDTYNAAIKAFCITGSSSIAFSLLAEMDKKSVKPDECTFGNLLAGFYNEQKIEDVGKVLKRMEQYGIKPGIVTYNSRIQSLCKLKKSQEAKALLDGMISRGLMPNTVTYCHLIHGFCKEEKYEDAKKLFADMRTRGVNPSSACYFTMISFLCQAGDYVSAYHVTSRCIRNGWIPPYSVMTNLVNGLIGLSKIDDAKYLIRRLKRKFRNENWSKWNEIEAELETMLKSKSTS